MTSWQSIPSALIKLPARYSQYTDRSLSVCAIDCNAMFPGIIVIGLGKILSHNIGAFQCAVNVAVNLYGMTGKHVVIVIVHCQIARGTYDDALD